MLNTFNFLAAEEAGGNFLVKPGLGVMIWTLIAFGLTLWILGKFALPRIQDALDKRQREIDDSIKMAEEARAEARRLLDEYRERLAQAREQADEIVVRARKMGESQQAEALELSQKKRDELLDQARRDIEAETRRAILELRSEVADLTVLATEKVTRKSLSDTDQRKLVQEALDELDFAVLSTGGESR